MHEIFIQYQSKENLLEIHMLSALTNFWHTSCTKAYSKFYQQRATDVCMAFQYRQPYYSGKIHSTWLTTKDSASARSRTGITCDISPLFIFMNCTNRISFRYQTQKNKCYRENKK